MALSGLESHCWFICFVCSARCRYRVVSYVFREGDDAHPLHIVLSGSVRIWSDFTTAMRYAQSWMDDSRLLSSSVASKKSFEQFLQGAFGLGK